MLRNQLFIEIICCVLFIIPAVLCAQSLDIQKGWKFQKGDNPAWALAETSDAQWQEVPVGEGWERFAGEDYDGFGWYRKRILIPSSLKAQVKRYGGFSLDLGRIDDVDQTFFNGNMIGQEGKIPSTNNATAWDVQRHYIIPITNIKWDVENVIAVRVYDSGGGGGLYTGPYEMTPLSWKNFVQFGIDYPFQNSTTEEKKDFFINVNINNQSKEKIKGLLQCRIYTFGEKELINEKEVKLIIKKRKSGITPVSFEGLPAGFYKIKIMLISDTGEKCFYEKGLAVSPEKVVSIPSLPSDFEAFWQKAKADLEKITPNYKIIPQSIWSNDKVSTFIVEMQSLDNVKIRAWLSIPKGKKNLPALLKVQGYSSYMMPDTGMTDAVVLALNIRGHGNSRDDVNPGFPGFLFRGFGSAEAYIYRGAYMDCLRAVDFICTREEVDINRIAVEGASQGGALSFATAALDKRIKLCMPDVPFLSDFKNYFAIADWPGDEFKAYQAKTGREWEDIYRVLSYFDIRNLAPKITCPVLMGVGLFDDVCPPQINFAAYNNLGTNPTEKSYLLYPVAGHSLPWQVHPPLKMEWMRAHFKK